MFQQVYRSASGNCHGIHDEWCYQSGIRCKDKGKKKITLNKTSLKLTVGQSKKLTVKNKPAKAKLKWSTSNKKVATVKTAR